MTWRFHIENLIRSGQLGYRLFVMKEGHDGSAALMLSPTLKTIPKYSAVDYKDAFLDDGSIPGSDVQAFLQAASDAAWELGIKPKQLENNKNELAAVRYHLEDMRQLAGIKK